MVDDILPENRLNIVNNFDSLNNANINDLVPVAESNLDFSIDSSNDRVRDTDKWLVNLTDLQIPTRVNDILKLGKKFCFPFSDKFIPFRQVIANIEGGLLQISDADINKPCLRNELTNILTNFKLRNTHRRRLNVIEEQLVKDVMFTKNYVKEHPNIIITSADKGNTTVVVDRADYISKINDMLQDTNTYKVLPKDSTSSIQTKLNQMVSLWSRNHHISDIVAKRLKSYHGVVAKLYGLPKIHKAGVPYRPIVSSIGTPLYEMSAFLSDILNKTVGRSNTAVKNSLDFRTKIKNVVLPNDYILISLDVISLFTNVDSKLVLRLINENWSDIKKNSSTLLSKSQYLNGMELVLNNCEFSFNRVIYKQLFGSPMGSPTSPAVANLVMEYIESCVLTSLDFAPLFFFRYVDDIITAIPKDRINYFFDRFNAFDSNIKFTMEIETEGRLAFLDLLLIHNSDGTISTDWFHKKTWSGRYLNFSSHLPLSYKKNTVRLLANKIIQLSDPIFHKDNFLLLKNTLLDNGYPNSIIRPIINSVIYKNPNSNNLSVEIASSIPDNHFIVSVPYVKTLFEQISCCLNKFNIKTVAKTYNNLGMSIFSNLKDTTALGQKKEIVYKVTCECDKIYIGQTKQLLATRFCQHKRDALKLNSNKIIRDAASSLSSHLHETGHCIYLDNVSILEHESNYQARQVLEMIHIKRSHLTSDNCLNKQSDCGYLQDIYNNIIV